MIDSNIRTAAHQVIELYGSDAAQQAARCADRMREVGDEFGYGVWKQIERAIEKSRVRGR